MLALALAATAYTMPSAPRAVCSRTVSPVMETGVETLPLMMPKQKTWMPKVRAALAGPW